MTATTERRPAFRQDEPKLHPAILGYYHGDGDDHRELRCVHLPDHRRLVVDWRSHRRADPRLVGALAADEPRENAAILARVYLADSNRGRCRVLRASDLHASVQPRRWDEAREASDEPLRDEHGASYTIEAIDTGKPFRELRWTRRAPGREALCALPLREVISQLQAYEPARSLTLRAIAWRARDEEISVYRLHDELRRVDSSRIVLNKRLREAVLEHVERGDSLSEIAMRCGRTKRNRDGSVSGETSWLTRRIGIRAEAGRAETTPWVHSDVLALIARKGLHLCPVEVEAR
jgi:hypothetical protein